MLSKTIKFNSLSFCVASNCPCRHTFRQAIVLIYSNINMSLQICTYRRVICWSSFVANCFVAYYQTKMAILRRVVVTNCGEPLNLHVTFSSVTVCENGWKWAVPKISAVYLWKGFAMQTPHCAGVLVYFEIYAWGADFQAKHFEIVKC